MKDILRTRQIHLDFHTHGDIPDVGARFDPKEFAETLAKAHVNSITCFARCHHGWIYYDTKAFPERHHPNLRRNLLPEQIEACHAKGIRVPIYVTVQWDAFTAQEHPEWRVVDPDGKLEGTPPYEPGFYGSLCVNSPYREMLKTHVQEIVSMMPTDGFFFDIMMPKDCSCRWCRELMRKKGVDPYSADKRRQFGLESLNGFKRDMSEHVRSLAPNASIFYNAGHVGTRHREVADAYTHFELETLPSGDWGYLHLPVTARYVRTLGKEYLGQTGKFHTSWGDFHSYKNEAALAYECYRMLALGAKCLVGDQLHPDGRLDAEVYRRVGEVYAEVEKKEPWCREAQPLADIGVLTPEETIGGAAHGRLPLAIKGATEMLEELAHQFDILDSHADLSRYRLVILPDRISVGDRLARALEAFVAKGGAVLASFGSGLTPGLDAPVHPMFGIRSVDLSESRDLDGRDIRGVYFERHNYAEYLRPSGLLREALPDADLAMYLKGTQIERDTGTEVLAEKHASYFDRDYRHFCSHRQTPSSGKPAGPAIIQKGRVIYFVHPVFEQYQISAPRWCKQLVANAIERLLPNPLVRHDGPSTLRLSLASQNAGSRLVLHCLHYIPERRCETIDVLEDVIPLRDVGVKIRTDKPVSAVRLAPSGTLLQFKAEGAGGVSFRVPSIEGHQMVEINL
ncbi:MAG TPA: beta-galactosidase trimerization domain-containing protein [Spirochaetia bacterium]|nr:beta-galactosidase trimerization domain-containing protein [Spirochaetia bacterium]